MPSPLAPPAPSPLDEFAAANVAPPVAPQPAPDELPADPVGHPYDESIDVPKGKPPERPTDPAPLDLAAQVKEWWARTNDTPEIERIRRQVDRDTATTFGMDIGKDVIDEVLLKLDEADLTNQHIYRNAVQSMALIMPEEPQVEIEPEPDCPLYDPNTRQPVPDTDGLDWKKVAFADLLNRLQKKLCKEAKVALNLRTGVQDAHHYELAVFKVTWQADYRTETMQEDRMPDVQSQIAEAESLVERYENDEFLDTDAEYRRMSDLLQSIEKQTELPIWRGIMVKSIPLKLFRWDSKVKRIEDIHQAEWMRQDYLMSRKEILRRFKSIGPDALSRAAVYQSNGTKQANDTREGEQILSQKPDGVQSLNGVSSNSVRTINDWDLLLVAEIWEEITQTVYILVEGLDFYARTYQPNRGTRNFYPFRLFLLNRPPGNTRLAGFSDTEMQAKEQSRLNRIDSEEDEAARNSINRGIYDKDVIEDDLGQKIADVNAHEWIGASFKGKDLSKAIVPLPGGSFNPEAFVTRRQTSQSNLRSMSGIPEQYTGATGDPKFAEQVKATASGSATLNKFRRSLVADLMSDVWIDICQLVAMNMSTDEVVEECGENARVIWDEEPKDRLAIFRRLKITVKPSTEGKPDKQETLNGIQLLEQMGLARNQPIPMDKIGPVVAQVLGLPIDVDAMLTADPNQLAAQLAGEMQKNPGAINPEVLQQLMQVLMPVVQQEIAQRAQQMAAEGAPGGEPGAGGPPSPGGAPASPPPMPSAAPPVGGAAGGMPPLAPGAGAGGPGNLQ